MPPAVQLPTFPTIAGFRQFRATIPPATPVAFVPTMGALHHGHGSLVTQARQLVGPSGIVIASIFVNPTQFGPNEDYNQYPRTPDADLALLQAAGCTAAFTPNATEIYPLLNSGHWTLDTGHSINPGPLAQQLEGAIRPGHFRGVCTVVLKLLNITQPHHMLMGQKDYQQQLILKHMTRDLNVPTEIITAPTVREADGLAMSSRNRYLSPEERPRAAAIYATLTWARDQALASPTAGVDLEMIMTERLHAAGLQVQYAAAYHAQTLAKQEGTVTNHDVLLVAVKLGQTRLIDNLPVA